MRGAEAAYLIPIPPLPNRLLRRVLARSVEQPNGRIRHRLYGLLGKVVPVRVRKAVVRGLRHVRHCGDGARHDHGLQLRACVLECALEDAGCAANGGDHEVFQGREGHVDRGGGVDYCVDAYFIH
jgi:hypothetical protein